MPKTCPTCQQPVPSPSTSAEHKLFTPPIMPGGLYGWKAIAKFLGVDPTTAKRYWRERHLPVIPFGDPLGRPRIWSHPSLIFAWLQSLAVIYRTFRLKQEQQGITKPRWH